jgi:hypothetical protein
VSSEFNRIAFARRAIPSASNLLQAAPGIHFQHPDQPPCAATRPQTHPLKSRIATLLQALHFMRDWHPLKSRIATLLQALHFMRDWQVNPFCRGGFRHAPLVPFPRLLGFGLLSDP